MIDSREAIFFKDVSTDVCVCEREREGEGERAIYNLLMEKQNCYEESFYFLSTENGLFKR